MGKVQRFEDLHVFQKSRELSKTVYGAMKGCRDYGFRDQIQRAAVSVVSNIAEGFESGTKETLVRYFFIAKGSAGEVRAQLYVGYDVGHFDENTFRHLKALAEECSRLLLAFVKKYKQEGMKGLQYKNEPKEDPAKEILRERGLVMTARGVMKREEAEEKGLEIFW